MTKEDLVGVYRGQGREIVHKDGHIDRRPAPQSQIIYSADGFMAVVSTPTGRAPVTAAPGQADLNAATEAERAAAAAGVVAYAGRFTVDGDTVFHRIEMALNPNLVGQALKRTIHIDGDDLTLTTAPDSDGSFGRIHWRRVR